MVKIGLVIPWREQEDRLQPFLKLCKWYETNLPEAKIYFADKGNDIWEMSATRNLGVRMAEADLCDVVIINDADTIPEIKPLLEAIEDCQKDNMIHNPYSHCKIFSKEETMRYYDGWGLENIHCRNISPYSNGGVYVCTPEAWWSIGGQDEKFVQWGWEDTAFEIAHTIIKGTKLIKHSGYIYSLNHKEQFHDNGYYDNFNNNKKLYMLYTSISTPEEMLELVKIKPIS